MSDLAARLLAAIEETERLALHAHGHVWTAHGWHSVTSADGEEVVTVGDSGGGVYDDPTAEHIAHNDPATVLRRCAADRRTVLAHNRYHECIELTGSGDRSVFDGKPWELWEPRAADDVRNFCFVIRSLAEGYGITEDQ